MKSATSTTGHLQWSIESSEVAVGTCQVEEAVPHLQWSIESLAILRRTLCLDPQAHLQWSIESSAHICACCASLRWGISNGVLKAATYGFHYCAQDVNYRISNGVLKVRNRIIARLAAALLVHLQWSIESHTALR